jgi:hypothetical protein
MSFGAYTKCFLATYSSLVPLVNSSRQSLTDETAATASTARSGFARTSHVVENDICIHVWHGKSICSAYKSGSVGL